MKILVYDFLNFTDKPGPRYRYLGKYSGEEFRELLTKLLKEYERVEIDATNIKTSFSPSFIDEAFNPIYKEMGEEVFFNRVLLFSRNNRFLEEKFKFYSKDFV